MGSNWLRPILTALIGVFAFAIVLAHCDPNADCREACQAHPAGFHWGYLSGGDCTCLIEAEVIDFAEED